MSDDAPRGDRALYRLESRVEQLTEKVGELKAMIQDGKGPVDHRLAAVEDAVNSRLAGIEKTLDRVSDRIEEKSRFPFALVFSFTGLLLAIGGSVGGFFLNGVNQNISRIDRDVSAIQAIIVPRVEHTDKWRVMERADSDILRRVEALEKGSRVSHR